MYIYIYTLWHLLLPWCKGRCYDLKSMTRCSFVGCLLLDIQMTDGYKLVFDRLISRIYVSLNFFLLEVVGSHMGVSLNCGTPKTPQNDHFW